jgi:PKD repeat protein
MRKENTLKKTAGLFMILFTMQFMMSTNVSAQCTANYTWMQTSNNVIAFTNTSTGTNSNTAYFWYFGDGGYGYGQNPVHTYYIPGTYTACLEINDSSLMTCNDTACFTITVTGSIICNVSAQAFENSVASCGTCADGSAYVFANGGTTPYTYSWNTVPPQTTTYANGLLPGTYTVCVTDMNSCTACANVTIDTSLCTAGFTWVQSANNTITFTNTSSGGTIPGYSWYFGDGSAAYTPNPVHFYSITGTYTVCMTMGDTTGFITCSDSVCHVITVTGVNCNLSVTATPTDASCGLCADGTASAVVTGGTPPYNYQWNTGASSPNITGLLPGNYSVCVTDANNCNQCAYITVGPNTLGCAAYFTLFADSVVPHTYWGINQSTGIAPISFTWSWGDGTYSTTPYPSHTYAAAGFYTICLTLTDTAGCSSTFCDSMYLLRTTNTMISVNILPPNTTGIKENIIQSTLPLFPNPARDYVVVGNISKNEKLISVTILNAAGNVVAKKNLRNNTFDISAIPPGVYFTRLLHPDGHYSSAKLVIMR